jgi:hypothetical protein
MNARFVCLGAAVLVLCFGLPARAAPPAPAARTDAEEAEQLIRQAIELRQQNKDERALPLLEKAYHLTRTPRTAGQLGLVEMALGYSLEAEGYLNEALASPDHPWVAKNLGTLQRAVARLREQIGDLTVTGTPDGAEVWVNGKRAGQLPLAAPVRLNKGTAAVELRAPGYVSASQSVVITGGGHQQVGFSLTREEVVGPLPPPPPPLPDDGSRKRLRRYAWAAAGVGAAAIGFGIVESFVAVDKQDTFNNHTGPDPNNPGRTITDCNTKNLSDACRPLADSYHNAVTLAVVGYGVGGALAIGSAVLFVMSSPKRHAAAAAPTGETTAFACAPSLTTPGVSCLVRF